MEGDKKVQQIREEYQIILSNALPILDSDAGVLTWKLQLPEDKHETLSVLQKFVNIK